MRKAETTPCPGQHKTSFSSNRVNPSRSVDSEIQEPNSLIMYKRRLVDDSRQKKVPSDTFKQRMKRFVRRSILIYRKLAPHWVQVPSKQTFLHAQHKLAKATNWTDHPKKQVNEIISFIMAGSLMHFLLQKQRVPKKNGEYVKRTGSSSSKEGQRISNK